MSSDALVLLTEDHKEVQRLFRRYRAETGTAARARAHQEHHVADVLCAEIDARPDDDPEFPVRMAVPADAVIRHVHAEELPQQVADEVSA
jgi:hypothetical protein